MASRKVRKKPSPNISPEPRRFIVYLDKQIPGAKTSREIVIVAPGEDADKVCSEVANTMIQNEIVCGWYEESE